MNYKIDLLKKINKKRCLIGIIGLGYVGLPLVNIFCQNKFKVLGFDIDKNKIKILKSKKSYIRHIPNKKIKQNSKYFFPTNNFSKIKKVNIIILCLPTPIKKNKKPNLSFIIRTIKEIKSHLQFGQLLILESSTYPGSTSDIILNVLKNEKFKLGKNFFVGYSPEREDPNNKKYTIRNIPKLCSGSTNNCRVLTSKIYSKVVKKVILMSSIEVTEFTKVFENTYRSINIALVNEMKLLAKKKNLNINEIISAASTKPFGFHPFQPGPGVGGHCIPVDPYYLSWVAKNNNIKSNFIDLAGKVNDMMPGWIIKESLKGRKIKNALIVGVTYKKNIDDIRESPSLSFIEILNRKKIKVDFYDPYVKVLKSRKLKKQIRVTKLSTIKKYDIVYILTDHDCINFIDIKNRAKLIVDTRNVYKHEIKNKIIKL